MDRETELREKLVALQAEYDEKAKPIVNELIEIANRKPIGPFIAVVGDFDEIIQNVFGGLGEACQCPQCQAVRAANAEREGKLH